MYHSVGVKSPSVLNSEHQSSTPELDPSQLPDTETKSTLYLKRSHDLSALPFLLVTLDTNAHLH